MLKGLWLATAAEPAASETQPLSPCRAVRLQAGICFCPVAPLSSLLLPLLSRRSSRQLGQPGPVKSPAHGSPVSGATCVLFCAAARGSFCHSLGLFTGLALPLESKHCSGSGGCGSPEQSPQAAEEGCLLGRSQRGPACPAATQSCWALRKSTCAESDTGWRPGSSHVSVSLLASGLLSLRPGVTALDVGATALWCWLGLWSCSCAIFSDGNEGGTWSSSLLRDPSSAPAPNLAPGPAGERLMCPGDTQLTTS